jgi:hypothetical protein
MDNELENVTTRADIVGEGLALHGEPGTSPPTDKYNEREIFKHVLEPKDSYDEDGTYWADMNIARRIAFVSRTDADEAIRELRTIGRMMKKDPLSPISFYTRNYIIPGMGLGLEGYPSFQSKPPTPSLGSCPATDSLTLYADTSSFPSATSRRSSRRSGRPAGTPSSPATGSGSTPSPTSRSWESSADSSSSACSVTGITSTHFPLPQPPGTWG